MAKQKIQHLPNQVCCATTQAIHRVPPPAARNTAEETNLEVLAALVAIAEIVPESMWSVGACAFRVAGCQMAKLGKRWTR
jgi:hypothetical protein